jgi:predicted lactoylglutathione lyase
MRKPISKIGRRKGMNCPNCGGAMWDNRANKRNPKAPDYKCKNQNCLDERGQVTAVWIPKAQQQPVAARAVPQEQIKKEMIISYEKDIMVLAGEILKAEMAAGIHPADRVARVREIYGLLISDFRTKVVGKYFPVKKPTPPPPPPPPPEEEVYDEEIEF